MLRTLPFLLAILIAPVLFAQGSRLWDGGPSGTGTDWSNAQNWAGDTLPAAGDDAVFDGSVTPPGQLTNVSGTVAAIRVWGSTSLALSLALSGNLDITGQNGGAITLEGDNGLAIASGGFNTRIGGGITLKDGDFTVSGQVRFGRASGNAYVEALQRGAGNISFGDTVGEQSAGSGRSSVRFRRLAPASGVIMFASLTIEGDTVDHQAGDENDSMDAQFEGVTLSVAGNVELHDGSGPASNAGGGGQLHLKDNVVATIGGNLSVGNNLAQVADSGAELGIQEGSVATFASGGTLSVQPHGVLLVLGATLTSAGPWTISCNPAAVAAILLGSTVTASAPGELSITLAGVGGGFLPGVAIAQSVISNYDADGLQLAAGTRLAILSETSFQSGQGAGTHLTLNGLDAGSTPVAELVTFDASTSSLVTIGSATALQFRAASGGDFGAGVTAAQAEAQDSDGSAVGTDVTWSDNSSAFLLTFQTSQPVGVRGDTTPDQAACFLELQGLAGNSVVDSIDLLLEVNDWGGGLSATDIASIKLFDDANANDALDSGELLVTGAINAGTLSFDLTGLGAAQRTIAQGATERWGMAITFNASITAGGQHSGKIQLFSLQGGVAEASGGIVAGMPLLLFDVIWVCGPADHVRIGERPDLAYAGLPFLVQPLVEVQDVNGVRCHWATGTVTPGIVNDPNSGASALTGSDAAGVAVVNGVAQFSDLGIDLAGMNFSIDFVIAPSLPGNSGEMAWLNVEGTPGEIGLSRGAAIADGGNDAVGNAPVGAPLSLVYTITNSGAGNLSLTNGVAISAQANCSVVLTAAPGASVIAPSGATTFTIEVTPTAAGAFSFSVSIANDDPDENPFDWGVSGTGIQQDVEVRRGVTVIADGGSDALAGAQPGVDLVLVYTIHNTGSDDLAITSVVAAAAGANCTAVVTGQPSLTTIAPGNSTSFTVTITPTSAGAFDATVSFSCDDPDEGSYDFTASGTAVAPASDDGGDEDSGCVADPTEHVGVLWLMMALIALVGVLGGIVRMFRR